MISVVIRAKNEEQYIAEALEAVLAQDDQEEFEIVVIDSGSTDLTKELVRKLPVRLEEISRSVFVWLRPKPGRPTRSGTYYRLPVSSLHSDQS